MAAQVPASPLEDLNSSSSVFLPKLKPTACDKLLIEQPPVGSQKLLDAFDESSPASRKHCYHEKDPHLRTKLQLFDLENSLRDRLFASVRCHIEKDHRGERVLASVKRLSLLAGYPKACEWFRLEMQLNVPSYLRRHDAQHRYSDLGD